MSDRPSISLLLIEDNPGDARLVREHLLDASGAQRFEVTNAPSLAGGIAFLGQGTTPHIVLLDLSLPDSFGLETLARWLAAAPTLPVIVLTGSDDEALAVNAVREGAQDYLVKGRIDGGLLVQAIRYAIERKKVEEDLRLAKTGLEHRVEERTAELQKINAQLQGEIAERTLAQQQAAELLKREQAARLEVEAANRSKDEFLAILSHELRTPLNAILGWAEILRTGEQTRDEVIEGVDVIERNARSQARLVEDVLEVSRIVCGKIRLNFGRVDLAAVVDAALSSARPTASAKSITLHPMVEPLPMLSPGDADRLQQVVWNLISNAIKFTPRGGEVTVRARQDETHTEIEVTDTGIGIQPDFLPFVFDRFRQSDASITRSHGGLGLGLSISRHLVEMHGGTVSAASGGEGKGATFLISLPLGLPDGHPLEEDGLAKGRGSMDAATATPHGLTNVRVLVLDDETDSRRVVVRLLTRAGALVKEADSASLVTGILTDWPADVLISDIAMPGEDGYSLIRRLRASPNVAWRTLPAMALTAFAREEDQARALNAGFQLHLAKPFEPAALLSAVTSLASLPVPQVAGADL